MRAVVLAGVVHHWAHQLQGAFGDVVQHRLYHKTGVVAEHLTWHTHTGAHRKIVALDLDVGWLGHNAVGNALGRHRNLA